MSWMLMMDRKNKDRKGGQIRLDWGRPRSIVKLVAAHTLS